MLLGANRVQFIGGMVALATGAALHLGNSRFALRRQNAKADVSAT
jgi:hypothetical protein